MNRITSQLGSQLSLVSLDGRRRTRGRARPRRRRPRQPGPARPDHRPALLERVRELRPGLAVRLGHIELNEPLLADTLAAWARATPSSYRCSSAAATTSSTTSPSRAGRAPTSTRGSPRRSARTPCSSRRCTTGSSRRAGSAGWTRRRAAPAPWSSPPPAPATRTPPSTPAARPHLLAERLGVPVVPAYASAATPTCPRPCAPSPPAAATGWPSPPTSPPPAASPPVRRRGPLDRAAPLGAHPAMARLLLHRYDQALATTAPTPPSGARGRAGLTAPPRGRDRPTAPEPAFVTACVYCRCMDGTAPSPHTSRHALRRRRHRALGRRARQTARPHRLPARPRPGAALRRAAPARRQDPGRHPRHPQPGLGRQPPHPPHPLPGVRPGRPRARRRPRLRPRPGGGGLPLPRPGPPALRPQRRTGAERIRRRLRRLRGQRPVAAAAHPHRTQALRPQRRDGELVSVGLNLTRAALDAATKYPWPRGAHPTDPGSPKFGVYEDDRPVFDWVRKGAPGTPHDASRPRSWTGPTTSRTRCTTSRTACTPGHIDPNCLHAEPERAEIFAVAIGRYVPADTDPAGARRGPRPPPRTRSGGRTATTAPPSPRPASRTPPASSSAASASPPRPPPARRTAPAGSPGTAPSSSSRARPALECAVLKAVADRYVMQRAEQERLRADQRIVVAELAEALTARAPDGLEPQFRALFDDGARRPGPQAGARRPDRRHSRTPPRVPFTRSLTGR